VVLLGGFMLVMFRRDLKHGDTAGTEAQDKAKKVNG